MRVYELIKKLQECNPFAEVLFESMVWYYDENDTVDMEYTNINSVYQKDSEIVQLS